MATQNNKKGCLRWFGFIFGGLLLMVLLLSIVGLVAESRGEARDREAYPPQGEIVAVGDREMHIHCMGEGTPTVVIDSGLGGWSIGWEDIQEEIAAHTRVCVYDRAGYGWSTPSSEPRTNDRIAEELHALLDAAKIEGPYVLVGFSFGGYTARMYADAYPQEVVGMVLVDPAHEDDATLLTEEMKQQQASLPSIYRTFALAARLGLVRWATPQEIAPYAPFISANASDAYYAAVSAPQWWQTSMAELMAMDESATLVRQTGDLGDIPLVVIGSDQSFGETAADVTANQSAREALLRDLAERLSTQGSFVLATDSTHEVTVDRPDVVIYAIEQVLAAVH